MNQVYRTLYNIGVGKTSIISTFSKGVFDEHEKVTTGANFSSKTQFYDKYDKAVKFEIWDTCGQEKYRSLTHLFYKDAIVAILVYDITSRKSYDEVTKFWYSEIKEKGDKDTILVLCGNKSDLFDKEAVTPEEAKKWAQVRKMKFFETSAKNSSGISEMFNEIGKDYLNTIYDFSDINKEGDNDNNTKENKEIDVEEKEVKKKERRRTDSIKLTKKKIELEKDDNDSRSECC